MSLTFCYTQNKMSRGTARKKRDLLLKVNDHEELVNSFEDCLERVFYGYISYSNMQFNYLYCGVKDNGLVKAGLVDHLNKFKNSCKKFSKFKKLTKFTIYPHINQEGDVTFKDKIEYYFNYDESNMFIDKEDLENLAEKFVEIDQDKISCKSFVTCEMNENFINLKEEISKVKELLAGDDGEIETLEIRMKLIEKKTRKLQIKLYSNNAKKTAKILKNKSKKFQDKYYHKYVMKKQYTFEYGHGLTNTSEKCAFCQQLFTSSQSVTKLRCGHMFCTGCIEKWMERSVTCYRCRTNPRTMCKKNSKIL